MQFINTCRNSVYLEDINLSIPFLDNQIQIIDTESIKKSAAFRNMIAMGAFKIVSANQSRIEQNLLKANNNTQVNIIQENKDYISNDLQIRVRGHFYDNTGYAKVNRNLSLYLAKNRIKTYIDPVTNNNSLNEIETRVLGVLRKPFAANAILVDSVIPPQGLDQYDGIKILYTTAETVKVPQQFIDIANSYNELWVTSNFSKQAFLNSGYNRTIRTVAPIINCNLYKKSQKLQFRPTLKKFNFLSVHTFGYRKGSDALLHAFCKRFTKYDDVSLTILSVENSYKQKIKIKKQITEIINQYKNPPTIQILTKPMQEYMMPSFYSSFDCFVLASRGEGFGLPICEAALCGLPVISVNYSAMTDYLNSENSLLLDVDDFEQSKDGSTGVHYWDNQLFPRLGVSFQDNLSDALGDMIKKYDTQIERNKLLQETIRNRYDGFDCVRNVLQTVNNMWDARKNASSIL